MKTCSLFFTTLFALLFSVHCQSLSNKNYTSYRIYPVCSPSDDIRYPENTDDVVEIVNEAISRNVTVKAFGARHSQTDIICTEGIPVDMRKLKSCVMNADNVTVTCGSGATVREVGEFLLQHGRAFRVTPAYGYITLGGAIGTGAHGSSIKYNSTISAQVVGLTVVDGNAQIVEVSDPEDVKLFKIHLGLLGIVVNVTLYTVPLYKVLAHNYEISENCLTNGDAVNWAQTSDQVLLTWFPTSQKVVVLNYTIVPVEMPGDAYTSLVPSSYGFFNLVVEKAKEIASGLSVSACSIASALGNTIMQVVQSISKSFLLYGTPGLVPVYTENGITIKNPAVGYPHAMFAFICSEEDAGLLNTACLWAHEDIDASLEVLDVEFAIALEDLGDFVSDVKDIMTKTPVIFPVLGLIFRFGGASDSPMSTAYQRDTVHVEYNYLKRRNIYDDASIGLAGYQTIAQTLVHKYSGRSHWGKSGLAYHSREFLDIKLDTPTRQLFLAGMQKFDPNGIFQNNFSRRLKQTGTAIDFDPKTTRCAILDNCICSQDSHCANTQRCISLPGYNYKVCKTTNEVVGGLINISLPPPLSALNWLNLTVPTLVTAALTTCALTGSANPVSSSVNTVSSSAKPVQNIVGSLLGRK